MDQNNPYSAPQSRLDAEPTAEIVLGGRGERLGAALIDGIIVAAVSWGLMYLAGATRYLSLVATGDLPVWKYLAGSVLAGFAAFVLIQAYPLATSAQTWGKKLLNLRIVDMQGRNAGFMRLVLLRYGLTRLLSIVPLYWLIDILFIFGDSRRCIHDMIADTRVVVAQANA